MIETDATDTVALKRRNGTGCNKNYSRLFLLLLFLNHSSRRSDTRGTTRAQRMKYWMKKNKPSLEDQVCRFVEKIVVFCYRDNITRL